MTKATKQGVFDSLLATYEGTDKALVDEFGGAPEDIQEWRDEYAAALQVPLPVIPKAVGEYIKWGKTYGIPTYMMFSFKFVRGQGFSKLTDEVEDWIISNSDAFTLAWLLGDWEVEE